MQRRREDAWQASNWTTVVLVDVALGVVIAVAGLVGILAGRLVLAVLLGGGIAYAGLAARRGLRWRRQRRDAGL